MGEGGIDTSEWMNDDDDDDACFPSQGKKKERKEKDDDDAAAALSNKYNQKLYTRVRSFASAVSNYSTKRLQLHLTYCTFCVVWYSTTLLLLLIQCERASERASDWQFILYFRGFLVFRRHARTHARIQRHRERERE